MQVVSVRFDASQYKDLLDDLGSKDTTAGVKVALRRASTVIKKQAEDNYRSKYPGSQLYRFIRVKAFKKGDGLYIGLGGKMGQKELSRNVSKYGDPAKKRFLLPMLNSGTGDRKTKKGYNRGRVTGSLFFTSAVEQKMEAAVEELRNRIFVILQKKADKRR